jgi:superfamily II DNA/RNA helicase
MTQGARNRAIMKMKRGNVRLLVATDVAARGLDVTGISHVINYDLPKSAEDYVHRIGRTGRAGATGIAISFVSSMEADCLVRIERYIGQPLTRCVIPGLEPRFNPGRQSGGRGVFSHGQGRMIERGKSRSERGAEKKRLSPGFRTRNEDESQKFLSGTADKYWNSNEYYFRGGKREPKRGSGKAGDFRSAPAARRARWT